MCEHCRRLRIHSRHDGLSPGKGCTDLSVNASTDRRLNGSHDSGSQCQDELVARHSIGGCILHVAHALSRPARRSVPDGCKRLCLRLPFGSSQQHLRGHLPGDVFAFAHAYLHDAKHCAPQYTTRTLTVHARQALRFQHLSAAKCLQCHTAANKQLTGAQPPGGGTRWSLRGRRRLTVTRNCGRRRAEQCLKPACKGGAELCGCRVRRFAHACCSARPWPPGARTRRRNGLRARWRCCAFMLTEEQAKLIIVARWRLRRSHPCTGTGRQCTMGVTQRQPKTCVYGHVSHYSVGITV